MGIPADVAEGLGAYISSLNWAIDRTWEASGYSHARPSIMLDPNTTSASKFLRIVTAEGGRARSVHSFVEKATGKVVKPAGWKAPAKSTAKATKGQLLSKFDVAEGLPTLLDAIREAPQNAFYGGMLYQ